MKNEKGKQRIIKRIRLTFRTALVLHSFLITQFEYSPETKGKKNQILIKFRLLIFFIILIYKNETLDLKRKKMVNINIFCEYNISFNFREGTVQHNILSPKR